MARPERFELPTPWFVARYSIQLSYGRAVLKGGDHTRTNFGAAHKDIAFSFSHLQQVRDHRFHRKCSLRPSVRLDGIERCPGTPALAAWPAARPRQRDA